MVDRGGGDLVTKRETGTGVTSRRASAHLHLPWEDTSAWLLFFGDHSPMRWGMLASPVANEPTARVVEPGSNRVGLFPNCGNRTPHPPLLRNPARSPPPACGHALVITGCDRCWGSYTGGSCVCVFVWGGLGLWKVESGPDNHPTTKPPYPHPIEIALPVSSSCTEPSQSIPQVVLA